MKKTQHRVILISDIHYTCQEKSTDPQVRTSAAVGDAFGYTQKEKVALALQDVQKEADSLDAVFVLGDLSLDDADYRKLPENYCLKFREEFMAQLTCPCYALPGNHDSYPDRNWMQMFGYGRQFSVTVGDAAFIALDTFAQVPATGASGAAFTDVDMVFLKQELEKCSQKKIFLLSHYFLPERNEALSQLVSSDPRILCLFQGHTHINRVLQPPCLQGTPLVDIGGYGYQGECVEGKWIFSRFDPAWAWGYQVLQWNEESTQTYHIKPQRRYQGSNGNFFYPGAIEDKLELSSPAISY
jgi:3',5'-cyclic AMP phosphodiesterase CpdA